MSEFLIFAAFVTRTMAVVFLALLWFYFKRSDGHLVSSFRQMFLCFWFLLAWVEIASIAEIVGFIEQAHATVEYSANWIWIPNLIIDIGAGRLLWHLYKHARGGRHHG